MSELDFSKPENLQTRDGRQVRIYATDGKLPHPIHQRVELVPSVAGSVWLKSHRGLDGQRCDGSRHVVKYHEGSEVLTED